MTQTDSKLLTFALGDEDYGVSILKVKEIIGMLDITSVPKTPEFIKGVINLRGKIIPVMDLRLRFKMEPQEYNERTCIIVVEIEINGNQRLLGVVVDMVSEVVTVSSEQIEPPPEYGNTSGKNSVIGIAKIKDRIVLILDMNKIFLCEEVMRLLDEKVI